MLKTSDKGFSGDRGKIQVVLHNKRNEYSKNDIQVVEW